MFTIEYSLNENEVCKIYKSVTHEKIKYSKDYSRKSLEVHLIDVSLFPIY